MENLEKLDTSRIEEEYIDFRERMGLPPVGPHYTKARRCINISDEAWNGLETVARAFNATWGGKPSVSQLIELIGTMTLLVVKPGGSNAKR